LVIPAKAPLDSSFPRKRESMLSSFGCDDSAKLIGSRWIPAFAGVTTDRRLPVTLLLRVLRVVRADHLHISCQKAAFLTVRRRPLDLEHRDGIIGELAEECADDADRQVAA